MVRAVRDSKFKYIRNFCPEKPYLLWIPYRNRHPMLQEMWRLHREDALEGPQKLMMQPTFREPMLVQVPFPAWAMRREDQATTNTIEDFKDV